MKKQVCEKVKVQMNHEHTYKFSPYDDLPEKFIKTKENFFR